MHTSKELNWLNDPGTSRRRSRATTEKFLAYSKGVLEVLKRDLANGAKIDPQVIRDLEAAIARYEVPKRSHS